MKKTVTILSLIATALVPAVAQEAQSHTDEASQPVTLPLEGGRPVMDATYTVVDQHVCVAYFSYSKALQLMPQYADTEASLKKLKEQYDAELAAAEREFTDKYELFLEQQSSLATAIRTKRQADLQALYETNVKFRAESQRLLAKAREDAYAPLYAALNAAIAQVGTNGNYLMLINTDNNACPYIDPARSENVTMQIIAALKK